MTHANGKDFEPRARLAGRELPRLGLGCARIGSFNNPASLKESQSLCARALACGVTLFDTADVYGQGDSERVIGRLAHTASPTCAPIIITKVGLTFSRKARMLRPAKPLVRQVVRHLPAMRSAVASQRSKAMGCDFSSEYLRQACAASKRRLGLSHLDALLLHSPSAKTLVEGSAVATMRLLRENGDIAAFGASLDEADALDAALRIEDLEIIEITPRLMFGLNTQQRASIARRGVIVLLREVLRHAPAGRPLYAIMGEVLSDPLVSTVIVGTTNHHHLDALVAAL